jgi:hypothetical protein
MYPIRINIGEIVMRVLLKSSSSLKTFGSSVAPPIIKMKPIIFMANPINSIL